VNGLRLKLFSFSVRGEPFDSPFALRFSKGERFAQDKLVETQKNTFAIGSTDRREMEEKFLKKKNLKKSLTTLRCLFIRIRGYMYTRTHEYNFFGEAVK